MFGPQFPWTAALFYAPYEGELPSLFCGGALVSTQNATSTIVSPVFNDNPCRKRKTLVLTAAHCIRDLERDYGNFSSDFSKLTVRLGELSTRLNDQTELDRGVKNIYLHSRYGANSMHDHDVALIEIDDVKPAFAARTLCLPSHDSDSPDLDETELVARISFNEGGNVSVAGWGVGIMPDKSPVENTDLRLKQLQVRVNFPEKQVPDRFPVFRNLPSFLFHAHGCANNRQQTGSRVSLK